MRIGNFEVGRDHPVVFIADIASNHGGALSHAKELVHACAESGVDAVKMQNFTAETIVSDRGFQTLGDLETHQSKWNQSVYDSYDAASIPLSWTEELRALCDELGMAYLTSPYSPELVDAVAPYVSAFKLGSGDITWHDEIIAMARHNKPILIATGASAMHEVEAAMAVAASVPSEVILMQCNTEYSAELDEPADRRYERFRHVNLRVLETYARRWPDVPLGLSDHTHGATTVLGAVGLFDCCAVEKHFTLDNTQQGQDHSFSMTPAGWSEMARKTHQLKQSILDRGATTFEERLELVRGAVDDPTALDLAIGDGVKRLEANEVNSVVVQRRALRASRNLAEGTVLKKEDVVPLRPCPAEGLPPYMIEQLLGRRLRTKLSHGELVTSRDLES